MGMAKKKKKRRWRERKRTREERKYIVRGHEEKMKPWQEKNEINCIEAHEALGGVVHKKYVARDQNFAISATCRI